MRAAAAADAPSKAREIEHVLERPEIRPAGASPFQLIQQLRSRGRAARDVVHATVGRPRQASGRRLQSIRGRRGSRRASRPAGRCEAHRRIAPRRTVGQAGPVARRLASGYPLLRTGSPGRCGSPARGCPSCGKGNDTAIRIQGMRGVRPDCQVSTCERRPIACDVQRAGLQPFGGGATESRLISWCATT